MRPEQNPSGMYLPSSNTLIPLSLLRVLTPLAELPAQ